MTDLFNNAFSFAKEKPLCVCKRQHVRIHLCRVCLFLLTFHHQAYAPLFVIACVILSYLSKLIVAAAFFSHFEKPGWIWPRKKRKKIKKPQEHKHMKATWTHAAWHRLTVSSRTTLSTSTHARTLMLKLAHSKGRKSVFVIQEIRPTVVCHHQPRFGISTAKLNT